MIDTMSVVYGLLIGFAIIAIPFFLPEKKNVDFLKPTYTAKDIKAFHKKHNVPLRSAKRALHKEFLQERLEAAQTVFEVKLIVAELLKDY